MQAPDPWAVLGREEAGGECGQPAVEHAAVQQSRPGERVVHHARLIDREYRLPGRHDPIPPRIRSTDERAPHPGDGHMIRPEEVAAELSQTRGEHREALRLHPVVAVDEAERLALHMRESLVACRGEPARLGVPQHFGVREPARVVPQERAGVVSRAVVYRHELEGGRIIELPGERLQRGADVRPGVLGRQDDGDANREASSRATP